MASPDNKCAAYTDDEITALELEAKIEGLTQLVEIFERHGSPAPSDASAITHAYMCGVIRGSIKRLARKRITNG